MLVIDSIAADQRLQDLKLCIEQREGAVNVSGLWGSSAPMVTALVCEGTSRTVLFITAHLEQADNVRDDIELFLGRHCDLFPAWETLPGEGAASGEIGAERLRLCTELLTRKKARRASQSCKIVLTPVQALMQPVPTPDILECNTIRFRKGSRPDGLPELSPSAGASPEALVAWAVDRGYERLDLVESPGDVARRGDIVDLFVLGDDNPVRIQFFDDLIESIRRIDISTQRSVETVTSVDVVAMPVGNSPANDAQTDLFAYLPDDALIVLDGPSEIQEMGETLRVRLGAVGGKAPAVGKTPAESEAPAEGKTPLRPMFDVQHVLAAVHRFPQMQLHSFVVAGASNEASFPFDVSSITRFSGTAADTVSELCHIARDQEVHVICDNEGERQRLREMIQELSPDLIDGKELAVSEAPAEGEAPLQQQRGLPPILLDLGVMHRGFEWCATRTVVVPHHEIFHRQRQKRRVRKMYAGRAVESWLDLKVGDLVVHLMHGIAVYRGLETMHPGDGGRVEEFLSLEFADKAMVHVPTSQIDLVQQYVGAGGRKPQLSKLGGKRWSKTKQQVIDSVADLAEALLRIQAIREQNEGTGYPSDTQWQREFEASFLYEETEDQLLVADAIREDLIRPRPMDRLVCGDVGYGKTELAMRAVFKVVEFGRQAAVLVPTTVLAEQHHRSFSDRFAEYPFEIACLSRFRSTAEQKAIVDRVKKGQVDIVIGTHRLLSKDVAFANLGLIVIDEEQRFGVEHKERLKNMRETVDVLTLTATPIPRTLHMAVVGIRDISSLQTPPVDRRAIATQVRAFDDELIRNAILREMNRDGQVYFVHNFVRSIASMAATVQRIVPEARVVFGHGQMKDGELEKVMHRFVRREADVLVATTIIESGIDIPSVNTIFIDRADRFGLADLHQLRGRVGRSSHRAYCYLLLSPKRPPTPKAAKRLKTIEEFSELGAGFRIAMRDLEIRGTGNLLGKEQSGHIGAVGYELYCRMLEQTVRRLRNEPAEQLTPVQVDLGVAAHIPSHYIRAERSRIEIYRRIVSCATVADLRQLETDLVDTFGPFPSTIARLLEVAEIRVMARLFGIKSINLAPPDVVFKIDRMATVEPVFEHAPGTVRMPDPETIHMRPPAGYLAPTTLLPILRNMFHKAMSQTEVAP